MAESHEADRGFLRWLKRASLSALRKRWAKIDSEEEFGTVRSWKLEAIDRAIRRLLDADEKS